MRVLGTVLNGRQKTKFEVYGNIGCGASSLGIDKNNAKLFHLDWEYLIISNIFKLRYYVFLVKSQIVDQFDFNIRKFNFHINLIFISRTEVRGDFYIHGTKYF